MTAHFGVLIPSTNTTVEIEYTRLLPASLQAHFARLGKAQGVVFEPSRDDDLAYQARLLGNAKVGVIALTQTSASVFDDDYDVRVKREMTEQAGVPAFTSAEAIADAVRALGGRRIALVSPYSEAVMRRTRRYYERRGLEIIATDAFGATDAYAIGSLGPENATEAFTRIDDPSIDVIVLPGGNFPAMGFLTEWERMTGRPIITTNQVVVWAAMAALEVKEPIPGLGTLLAELPLPP